MDGWMDSNLENLKSETERDRCDAMRCDGFGWSVAVELCSLRGRGWRSFTTYSVVVYSIHTFLFSRFSGIIFSL